MAHKYQVKPAFAKQYPDAVTIIDGVTVLLSGVDREFDIPGTDAKPPTKRKLKVATPKQLEHLFEVDHNPHIEKLTD